jgi:hypothetical protein
VISASSTEENITSEGILEGFLTMGEEPALLLNIGKKNEEKLRIIPVNTILLIDVIEYTEDKGKEEKGDVNYIS